jgi:ATP-binding cassette subfamily B protein
MGLRNILLLVGGLIMLVSTTPRLMLTVVGIIVLVVLPAVLIARRVRRLSRASQDRLADTSGIAGEILNAIPVVQSYTRETAEALRFAQANEQAFAASIRRSGTRSALTAFVIVGVFAALLYGMYGGVRAVLAGEISAGQFSQTALYVMVVAGSVAVLAEVWGDLLRAAGATERLMELLAARSPIAEPALPIALPASRRAVCRWSSAGCAFRLSVAADAQSVLQGSSSPSRPGRRWPWSVRRAPARRLSFSCCSASTRSAQAPS